MADDYYFQRRGDDRIKPKRTMREASKTSGHTTAEQLSSNRAAKRAALNTEHIEHARNVYHLNRRIENGYSLTERRKNPYDALLLACQHSNVANTNLYRGSLHNTVMTKLIPGTGRPKSAPTVRRSHHVSGDGYQGWSTMKGLRDAFPADDFPLEAWYEHTQQEASYVAYKRAMMQEIITQRLYREADLRQLFHSYQKLAPLRDKEAVDRVVRDLKLELDVRYPNRVEA